MAITLKAARVNANLTQQQVADNLKWSKNTIASYESYKTKPSIERAKQLASLYGMKVDDIIFFEN